MRLSRTALWFLFQPSAQGPLPILFAATAPQTAPGGYYGPGRWRKTHGHPAPARLPPQAEDRDAAARLWTASERMTGLRFA